MKNLLSYFGCGIISVTGRGRSNSSFEQRFRKKELRLCLYGQIRMSWIALCAAYLTRLYCRKEPEGNPVCDFNHGRGIAESTLPRGITKRLSLTLRVSRCLTASRLATAKMVATNCSRSLSGYPSKRMMSSSAWRPLDITGCRFTNT